MRIKTSKGFVSVEDIQDIEELQKAAKSLGIKGYQLIKEPKTLIAKIKAV